MLTKLPFGFHKNMPRRIIKKIQKTLSQKSTKKVVNIKLFGSKKEDIQKTILAKEYLPLKKALLKKEKKLKKQLANIANKRKSIKGDYKVRFPFFGRGKDEDAQEVSQYENHMSLEHQLEIELEKINKALKKIKNGTYGICTICKGKIQLARLKIYPEAEHCMTCHKKGV